MSTQVVEKHFRDSVLTLSDTYIDKIQVNIHAHSPTFGDYRIQTKEYDVLVECKQVSISNKQHRFAIDRLTQEFKLMEYSKRFYRNKSFLFLCFWKYSKKSSHAYLIPIEAWLTFRKNSSQKTLTLESCNEYFLQYKCEFVDKQWKIVF